MKEILFFIERCLRAAATLTQQLSQRIHGWYLAANVTHSINDLNTLIEWDRISGDNLSEEFDYKDETWNEIRFISQCLRHAYWKTPAIPIMENECRNDRLIFTGRDIQIYAEGKTPNRWVFLPYKKSLGSIYAIDYDIRIFSEFKEIQFGFNYESIAKRLRFMILDNRELVFQVVENGTFYQPLKSVQLSFILGRQYHVRIEVIKDSFFYYVDGKLLMSLRAVLHEAKDSQNIVLIFWENKNQREIKATLENISIYRGKFKTNNHSQNEKW
jgi:hypothetical protein